MSTLVPVRISKPGKPVPELHQNFASLDQRPAYIRDWGRGHRVQLVSLLFFLIWFVKVLRELRDVGKMGKTFNKRLHLNFNWAHVWCLKYLRHQVT